MVLLLALLGGVGMYAATGNKQIGLATGASIAIIALLVLYQQGKADRKQLENELSRLNEREQAYWRPVVDQPELLQEKVRDLFDQQSA